MDQYISFPSKTFLVGEYAVLEGAPAVIVNTNPRFYFSVSSRDDGKSALTEQDHLQTPGFHHTQIHPNSPAGHWLAKHPHIQNYNILFCDPHSGHGGFGLSSAQFNLVYYLKQFLEYQIDPAKNAKISPTQEIKGDQQSALKLWQSYQSLSFEGRRASGADVVSQWIGNVCLFISQPFNVESISWPFSELDFILLRTGITVNTWEHLKNLKLAALQTKDLKYLANEAITQMKDANAVGFATVLNDYAICLQKLGLVHQHVLELLQQIKSPLVTAAKGCGALGAEVICVLFHPKDRKAILQLLKEKNIVASSSDLTGGIHQHLREELPQNIKLLA